MSVSLCGKCRTPNTPEHQQSDFHLHNEDLASRGIMPISQAMFDTYQKHKSKQAKSASSTSNSGNQAASSAASSSQPREDNVAKSKNSWHWEEGDYTEWAEQRLPELLKQAEIPGCQIKSVSKIEGDAYINKRRGRLFAGYDFKITLEWEGSIKDDDGEEVIKAAGKARLPDVSPDVDDHNYVVDEITVNGDTDAHDKLRQTMCKEGRQAIRHQIKLWAEELESKIDEE